MAHGAHALWQAALDADKPLVLDADGLNLLAREHFAVRRADCADAASRRSRAFAGCQRRRCREGSLCCRARGLARKNIGAVVVLKGSGSLIADPDGRLDVCPWGNPGMASGGMGDLLTGIIAACWRKGARRGNPPVSALGCTRAPVICCQTG
jgi:NAD(P)H-hydrate repair Nnr-like enzyme with NAD(P)H-hydrate dehydratase domain